MKRWKNAYRAIALLLSLALSPSIALAQAEETLAISGTFMMHYKYGTVGDDLAAVFTNDYAHGWTLTLQGVSYATDTYADWYYADWYYDEWGEYWFVQTTTRVHASSLDFAFFGPDAEVLNAQANRLVLFVCELALAPPQLRPCRTSPKSSARSSPVIRLRPSGYCRWSTRSSANLLPFG